MKTLTLTFVSTLLLIGCLPSSDTPPSPYAGEETRSLKALSDEEINGYLSGEGMGFAMAAELNQYPGPKHVLALADDLSLSPEQRTQTEGFFEAMQAEAQRLGEALVEKERVLDAQFANKEVVADSMKALLHQIGSLRAEIRFAHLQAHLQTEAILTDQQITHYNHLRGYGQTDHSAHDHSDHAM